MSNKVPEGWDTYELKEISAPDDRYSFVGGPFGSNLKSEEYTDQGIRIIQLQNIGDGEFKDSYKIYTSPEKADELHSSNIYPGDIILSKMGDPVARAAIIPPFESRYLMASDGIRLAVDKSRFDAKFIHDSINDASFRTQAELSSTGSTRKRIGLTTLRQLTLAAPPLPEQQKIAAILSSVDDVIEKTRAQVDKLKDLKTGMMQELLTNGIGHTEFKDSPVGRIPASWSVIELKQIAAVKGGKRMPKGKPFAGHVTPHPYIRVSDLGNGTIRQDNLKYVLPKDREAIKRYTISKNDLYISIAGTIGMVGSVPETLDGAQLTENAAKIVFYDLRTLCPSFVKHVLTSGEVQERLNQEKGTGGGVPKLALFRIESTQLPMPPLSEQRSIGKALDAMDQRLTVTHEKLIALMNCKKALMQDLLTGKVRVKVDQKESAVA